MAVVGGGLAGLVLARSLTKLGHYVVVLESGGEQQLEEVHPLNEVELTAQRYQGATEGRFRALGGTSTRWGAALLPYLHTDLDAHPCGWHDGWGLNADDLAKYLAPLEHDFGIVGGGYEGENRYAHLLPSFLPRLPKWPAFRKRSISNVYRDSIASDPRLIIWVNATVTEIKLDMGRVRGLTAKSDNGHELDISTTHVAIAAGAIETTRLLLLLDRAHCGRIFTSTSPLGQGFHDHLSAPIAVLNERDRGAIIRLFGFRFTSGGMRNLRFELAPRARAGGGLPGAFLHVAFSRDNESGFEGLRRFYQAIQRGSPPALTDIGTILADLPWFLGAVWWRFAEKRVLPPTRAQFLLHLVTEQKPDCDNRICLSPTARDHFGQPRAQIHWEVRDEDLMHFARIANLATEEWATGPLAALAGIMPRPAEIVAQELVNGGGIYHPAGTTRMGSSAADSVVDSQLRVHGVTGLWSVATSVFPSIGGTSPSLGLMQFALRAAENIAVSVARRS